MNVPLTTMPTPEHFHTDEVSQQTIILEGNMSDTAIEDDNSEQNEKKEEETTLRCRLRISVTFQSRGSGPPSLPPSRLTAAE